MTKMESIFPVVFFDGERETTIGNVVVYPSLDYKSFLSILSLKIGISPNQFSVYLGDGKTSRKIPVTSKANFSAISREEDCWFVVVLRRSRARRQRMKAEQYQQPQAGNVMLLKRNNNGDLLKNAILRNYNHFYNFDHDYKFNDGGVENEGALACEECVRAKETGREIGFHWCVYDAVTFGFRSHAGPIARPVKG